MAGLSSPSLELKTVNFTVDQFTTKSEGRGDTCPGR